MTEEKKIMVVKPKTLSEQDKKKIEAIGIVCIEHPTPEEVLFLTDHGKIISNDDMFLMALKAMVKQKNSPEKTETIFIQLLDAHLSRKRGNL